MCKCCRCETSPSFFNSLFINFNICSFQWLNFKNLKDDINGSYNGVGVAYLLQSVAIHFNLTVSKKDRFFAFCVYKNVSQKIWIFLGIWYELFSDYLVENESVSFLSQKDECEIL